MCQQGAFLGPRVHFGSLWDFIRCLHAQGLLKHLGGQIWFAFARFCMLRRLVGHLAGQIWFGFACVCMPRGSWGVCEVLGCLGICANDQNSNKHVKNSVRGTEMKLLVESCFDQWSLQVCVRLFSGPAKPLFCFGARQGPFCFVPGPPANDSVHFSPAHWYDVAGLVAF